MKKVYYNKLIRDKIPANLEKIGAAFETKKLGIRKFRGELLKKVSEEASGLLSAKNKKELISELADVCDVIDAIKKSENITSQELARTQKKNFKTKGGFKKKIFLIWSEDTGYKTNEKRYSKK